MHWIRRAWQWLFLVPDKPLSVGGIIAWWELRRIPYNLIVAAVGIPSLLLFYTFILASGTLASGEDAVEPLTLIIAPIIANICYTLGWMVEIPCSFLFRLLIHDRVRVIGPALFALGLVLSLLVVIFPAAFWGIYCLLHLASQ